MNVTAMKWTAEYDMLQEYSENSCSQSVIYRVEQKNPVIFLAMEFRENRVRCVQHN
jgi:hypothetical protein